MGDFQQPVILNSFACLLLTEFGTLFGKDTQNEDARCSSLFNFNMLSEYELLNIASANRYTRIGDDGGQGDPSFVCTVECSNNQGPVHLVDEQGTNEHNYIHRASIRNLYDLFMCRFLHSVICRDDFQEKEEQPCLGDWSDGTIAWKTSC